MIYIDTGAFIARHLKRDQYNETAVTGWKDLQTKNERYFTSNFVLDETFTLLGSRAGYKFASQRARNIYLSDTITILRPDREAEIKALDLFEKYSNLEVSYTDCISFVLMSRNRIDRVFSFDKHFEIAGFTIFPQLKY
ncbi:MAG: VapC toxin family PIN domain ribonuclease [Spirochaetes bacterium]|nr:MAG: VapC toxin family PIN domain ribonuclease [Spirochaetota bacterium]